MEIEYVKDESAMSFARLVAGQIFILLGDQEDSRYMFLKLSDNEEHDAVNLRNNTCVMLSDNYRCEVIDAKLVIT